MTSAADSQRLLDNSSKDLLRLLEMEPEDQYTELGAVLAISIIAWLNSIDAIMLFPYVMYSNDMLF